MAAPLGLYSRVVAVLKVGLPLVAVAMLAALFFISNESAPPRDLIFSQADLDALGDGMQVLRPVLSGVTDDNDRFRFTAERVSPDQVPPTKAEIETLGGRMDFADGRALDLSAASGALDLGSQRLTLRGGVRLVSADGYAFTAGEAEADLRGGGVTASGGVAGTGPMGRIAAERATVRGEHGSRVILFEAGVTLVYDPASAAK